MQILSSKPSLGHLSPLLEPAVLGTFGGWLDPGDEAVDGDFVPSTSDTESTKIATDANILDGIHSHRCSIVFGVATRHSGQTSTSRTSAKLV